MLVTRIAARQAVPVSPVGLDFWNPVIATDGGGREAAIDFWLSEVHGSTIAGLVAADFWLDGLSPPAGPAAGSTDLSTIGSTDLPTLDLPWFDGDLATRPARQRLSPTSESTARKRARWLVQLLDLPNQQRRSSFRSYFEELFSEFESANTFRALAALAIDDAPPETLINACEFRRHADGHPYLLSLRRGAKYRPVLTWARSFALAQQVGGDNPFDHLEQQWLDEWLELAADDRRAHCFLDYLTDRLRAKALGYWSLGEAMSGVVRTADHPSGRSTTGTLVYGGRQRIGVLYPECQSLVSFQLRSFRVGPADSRVLGSGHA